MSNAQLGMVMQRMQMLEREVIRLKSLVENGEVKEGPPGPPGPAGKDGKDGKDGKNGNDGKNGKDGKDGSRNYRHTVSSSLGQRIRRGVYR